MADWMSPHTQFLSSANPFCKGSRETSRVMCAIGEEVEGAVSSRRPPYADSELAKQHKIS